LIRLFSIRVFVIGLVVTRLVVTGLVCSRLFWAGRLSTEQVERDSDRSFGTKPPKSISTAFVKTLEAEHELKNQHPIESQQIDSRPFA
jgi:hypothetical protein